MEHFIPLSALLGGALIGLGAAVLLYFNGRIAGVSGIVGNLLQPARGDTLWRVAFVAGLLAGGLLLQAVHPAAFHSTLNRSAGALAVAGLLVGYGSRLGNGCTSGHSVCGISRLSVRSLVATAMFMATGMATVALVRHLLGGAA
jgi:hypothetical protein